MGIVNELVDTFTRFYLWLQFIAINLSLRIFAISSSNHSANGKNAPVKTTFSCGKNEHMSARTVSWC